MQEFSEETQKVGKEIQNFLAANGMTRDELAKAIRRGKSCVDKLCSGRYSEKTLAAVVARTKFVRSNAYAAEVLGRYSKSSWENYIGNYIMIEPSHIDKHAVWVRKVSIKWIDDLPGLAVHSDTDGRIGAISIPHERTPLIYIKSEQEGLYFAVSTMVGERAMRGLKLSVQHVVANAYVPSVCPVSIIYATEDIKAQFPNDDAIISGDQRLPFVRDELKYVIDNKYGIFIGGDR